MPTVSVSIPCYNVYDGPDGEAWLRRSIESVLGQTFASFELLLIDDGSDDATYQLLEEYDDDPRVRVVSQDNRGYPGARNTGLDLGDGDYYGFIGQDDVWEPEKLERQVAFLESSPAEVVHSNVYHIDAAGDVTELRHERPPPQPGDRTAFVRELFHRNFVCIQSALCEAGVLAERRFDESLSINCDHDLWLRIAGEHDIAYREEVLVRKRYHGANTSTSRYERLFEERTRMVEKAVERYPFLADERDGKLSSIHLTYGINLLEDGRPADARRTLRRAIALDPGNWRAYGTYALALGGGRAGHRLVGRLAKSR